MKNPRNCVDFIGFCDVYEIQRNLMRQHISLDVKQEVHDVAVFDDIVFTF